MGFSASWIGFHGTTPSEAHRTCGLRTTGRTIDLPSEPFQMVQVPTGWTIVYANDSMFAEPDAVMRFSIHHDVVAFMIQDNVSVSVAMRYKHGVLEWEVVCDMQVPLSEPDRSEIEVSGALPAELQAVLARPCEFLIDRPADLAEEVCQFRHDRLEFDWGTAVFEVLTPRRPWHLFGR